MGFLTPGTLILTFATLFNFIQLSSHQTIPIQPPPYPPNPAPSYVIENNMVRLTGHSIGGTAIVADGFFLGVVQHGYFHPVDPDDLHTIFRIRDHRLVPVTNRERDRLTRIFADMVVEEALRRNARNGASSPHRQEGRN